MALNSYRARGIQSCSSLTGGLWVFHFIREVYAPALGLLLVDPPLSSHYSHHHSLKMKYSLPLLLSAALAAAAPAIEGAAVLEKRQKATELSSGPCKDVTFIWVRGTTETANLVSLAFAQDLNGSGPRALFVWSKYWTDTISRVKSSAASSFQNSEKFSPPSQSKVSNMVPVSPET